MKTALKLSALSMAALLAVGCASNKGDEETSARLSANDNAAARAQLTADEANRKDVDALDAAEGAQQTADEANERALRMVERYGRQQQYSISPPLQQSGGRGLSNPSELPVGLTKHLRHPLLGKHQITDLLPVQAETGHQFIAFLQQLLNRRLLVQYRREAM